MLLFHSGVALTISDFPFAVLVSVNVISLALSCDFSPSIHVFVPLTLVSGFIGTILSKSSSVGPFGTVAVATLYIKSKFVISVSVTV